MNESHNIDHFIELCAKNGCRCTPQRLAVYRYICGNRNHPDVDTIWNDLKKEMPFITRESVFRILNELSQMGIIYRMDKIVNAHFDGSADSHGHFICESCGAIRDFETPACFSMIPEDCHFQVNHVEVRVSGLCPECAARVITKMNTTEKKELS